MKKQNLILSTALAAAFSSSVAFAEAEVTGKIVHESAAFTSEAMGIGSATTWNQVGTSHGADVMKSETSLKVFIDGSADNLKEGATYHAEIQGYINGDATNKNYKTGQSDTQNEVLREAYVDLEQDQWSIRAGKQQVVWGTADGMKLLDTINPTDYTEMAQNQMEDSRIPVWMINAETELENGGSFQFILSEAKGNKIAGLNSTGDSGHAFVMKGVDTLTGQTNGFLNIAPGLGKAAGAFEVGAGVAGGLMNATTTVGQFNNPAVTAGGFDGLCTGGSSGSTSVGTNSNAYCMYQITNTQSPTNSNVGANLQDSLNLTDASSLLDATTSQPNWDTDNPDSMFEYLHKATFGTFDAFIGMDAVYRKDYPEFKDGNVGFKYKNSTDSGVNYSLNFLNHYDSNPYIDLSWENQAGTKLYENAQYISGGSTAHVRLSTTDGSTTNTVGGAADGLMGSANANNTGVDQARLVMTEKLNRINSLGGSFDTAIETESLGPVVIRGEFLYDKGVKTPVITRKSADSKDLEHGFFTNAFKMKEGDMAKYVLGVDITLLTNMMVSGQFIQINNLNYVDEGNKDTDNWKYTADMSSMHLTNNLQKAIKQKEFYSLFLSKPFGASGEHRWNNILMLEEGGGKWNRLDAEFSINDNTQVTVEWNKYMGDENTQFGQLKNSSNVQAGFKYSF